jgi:hypothetical protein
MTTTANPNPVTMIQLAAIAYDDMHSIPGAVENLGLGLKVVWGPAEAHHGLDPIPYSAAFIASNGSGEYTVVIRGTEWDSLSSWEKEDFDVAPPQPFSQFAGNAGSGAMISPGARNGLNDLLNLTDPKTGLGMVAFLKAKQPPLLYVTGHSLGGTLTPPLFACLNYQLYGGVYVDNMAPCSFAGLTAGNAAFNSYFNGLFSSQGSWRFYNTLDIAPLLWEGSVADLEAIYQPQGLHYGFPESDVLGPCFQKAQGIGYQQPAGGHALTGWPINQLIRTWATQAMVQHHHATYITLVGEAFPAALRLEGILQPEPEPLA